MNHIDSIRELVESGDLIFRSGTDDISRVARKFNRIDTSFSHCGIILVENDTPFVYHALGGDYNPNQKLRRDPVERFYEKKEIDRIAIYRYDLSKDQEDTLTGIVRQLYSAGLKFDLYFNFLTDDQMYCSEFVFKCFDRALSGDLSRHIQAREWPFGVSPDDLFLHPRSRLVRRIELR